MLLDKTIMVKWGSKNKKHYEALGYKYTKIGKEFEVKVEDLTNGCHELVSVKCDNCGTIKQMPYYAYIKCHSKEFGDLCKKCQSIKSKATCLKRYGVDSYSKTDEFLVKLEDSCMESLGVKYPMQSLDVLKKAQKTNLDRYGFTCSAKNEDVIKRNKQTKLERYGDENYNNSEQMVQTKFDRYGEYYVNTIQTKQTKLERYGDENYNNSKKGWETKIKNGNAKSSKPERAIVDMLKDIYGECNCTWQKEVKINDTHSYYLDCEVIVKNIKIDFEYNGRFWHSGVDSIKHDILRSNFLLSNGYKILNVNGVKSAPSKDELQNAIDVLVETDVNSVTIELDY